MKIAWFTPFSKTSAIGHASRLITNELAKSAEVHIWHPEAEEIHATSLPHVSYPATLEIDASMLAPYDLAVYNLGNHLGFHRQIFEASRRAPGLVILHDFVMRNFFAGYWRQDVPGDLPLFEEAIHGAWGVVVHSEFLRRHVAQAFPGPVKKLGLPYTPDRGGPVLSRTKLGIPEDRTLILTIGHVNPNKRIPSVIEALGRCRGAIYVIAGPCEDAYRETLESLARENGLGDAVCFTGYTPDVHLHSYLEHADLCVNLRYPVTEGASGSVIEEMLYGKPVIVTDTGFFSELPDDCVRKVNPHREREELPEVLRELLRDPAARHDMGARAKRYAEAEFRADAYAAGIVEMAGELLHAKPLLRYADRIGDILSQMGVSADMPLIDTVGKVSAELFSGRRAS